MWSIANARWAAVVVSAAMGLGCGSSTNNTPATDPQDGVDAGGPPMTMRPPRPPPSADAKAPASDTAPPASVPADLPGAPVPPASIPPRTFTQKKPIPVIMLTSSKALVTYDEVRVPGTIKVIEDHDGTLVNIDKRPAAYEGAIGVKYRGDSSQYFMPQLSYSVELWDDKGMPVRQSLLGLPAEEDWALVACYTDKHCMRNAMAYAMAREFGRWNPGLVFVEVFVDGKYNGLYQFIETIKTNKSRVVLSDPAMDGTGLDITGTYVIRREGDGKGKPANMPATDWVSMADGKPVITKDEAGKETLMSGHGIVYAYHEPSERKITPAQAKYIQKHMADFETMMAGPTWNHPKRGYTAWIDVASWADYALINEVSNNIDGYFKSMYIVKHRDVEGARGKLQMTPLWDFNIAFGNVDYRDGWRVDNWVAAQNRFSGECSDFLPVAKGCNGDRNRCHDGQVARDAGCWSTPYLPSYWNKLWDDVDFQDALKCRWQELRKGPFSFDFIDTRTKEWKDLLTPAYARQLNRWGELRHKVWPNPCEPIREKGLLSGKYTDKFKQEGLPHPMCAPSNAPADKFMEHEIGWFVAWTKKRIEWLDKNLPGTCAAK